jgi:putative SOS response-associated peptidase YedK
MCGRYTLGKMTMKKFEEALGLSMPALEERYNVCPGQDNPVIRGQGSASAKILCEPILWGFVPNWLEEPAAKASTINARVETIAEKPYFRDAYGKRRCLVPADGYYEWRQVGRAKIPHYLQLEDGQSFAFAGLWDKRDASAETFASYAIVTTEATEAIHFIHHRMPVVLPEDHWGAWLDEATPINDLPAILGEAVTDFHNHPVSSLVNSRDSEGPELVKPTKRSLQGEFDFT